MATLFLHIGTPKTGTTAIQIFLNKNSSELKKNNCIFPDFEHRFPGVRKQRNGHFLCSNVKNKNLQEDCFRKILNYSKQYSKIILTDEELWNTTTYSEKFWVTLKNNLDKHNIKLKVIVYLRRQDSYFTSQWAQKIKGVKSQIFTFHQFLDDNFDNKIRLDYYDYISYISHFIGKENIIVRPYEFSQFKDNSIIADFMNVIDVDFDDNFVRDDTIRNISIEGNVLEVKRYLNMVVDFRKNNPELFRSCLETVQNKMKKDGTFRNCSTFLKGERSAFMKKYNEGNRKIAEEFLHRKDGVLFETPLPDNDPIRKHYSIKELKYILDLLTEVNKTDSFTPFSDEKFRKIANEAFNLILDEKSLIRKLKKKLKSVIKK